MRKPRRPQFNIRNNVKFKNRLNGEVIIGDLINEEEIEGRPYYVVKTEKGNFIKLTKEAYTLQK